MINRGNYFDGRDSDICRSKWRYIIKVNTVTRYHVSIYVF